MLKINNVLLIISVFFFSWFFFFALTQGINFFWEDVFFFENINSSLLGQSTDFFSAVFDAKTVYSIENYHRPLQKVYWGTLADIFGENVIFYRIYNSIMPAFFATILFWIIKRYSNSYFSILAVMYFISWAELFIAVLYATDTRMIMHFFTALALLLFFVYINEKKMFLQYLLSLIIIITSRLSLLLKHEGRIVLPVIILFCTLFKRNILKRSSFVILIALLIITTTPWLCFKKQTCGLGLGPGGAIVNLSIQDFFLKFYTVIYVIGLPTTILLAITLSLIIYFIFLKNNKNLRLNSNLTNLVFFSFVWLLFELSLVYASKQFDLQLYRGATFQKLDFAIIIFPLTLLVFSSVIAVSKVIKPFINFRRLFLIAFFILISLSIATHMKDLNSWRGGWGEYFIGWNQVREYIDARVNNSLLILHKPNFNVPFISFSTNNAIVRDVLDVQYVESIYANYSKVFGADRTKLPKNRIFINCKEFQTEDKTIYGTFKKYVLGIKSRQRFELCEYDYTKISNKNK